MSQSKIFDLKYQLLQYGSHHHNPWNVGIHLTCIPLILWTALVGAAKSGPFIAAPAASAVAAGAPVAVALSQLYKFCPPNAALLTMIGYTAYYIKLDKVAGVSLFSSLSTCMQLNGHFSCLLSARVIAFTLWLALC